MLNLLFNWLINNTNWIGLVKFGSKVQFGRALRRREATSPSSLTLLPSDVALVLVCWEVTRSCEKVVAD